MKERRIIVVEIDSSEWKKGWENSSDRVNFANSFVGRKLSDVDCPSFETEHVAINELGDKILNKIIISSVIDENGIITQSKYYSDLVLQKDDFSDFLKAHKINPMERRMILPIKEFISSTSEHREKILIRTYIQEYILNVSKFGISKDDAIVEINNLDIAKKNNIKVG